MILTPDWLQSDPPAAASVCHSFSSWETVATSLKLHNNNTPPPVWHWQPGRTGNLAQPTLAVGQQQWQAARITARVQGYVTRLFLPE